MGAPTSAQWNQMVQVYAICTIVMHLKYFATIMYAANPDDHPEEDAKMLAGKLVPSDIKRRQRTVANDIENVPYHFVIFWASFIVQGWSNASGNGERETVALTCLIVIYVACRCGFTLCYVYALQPWRTVLFVLSQMTVFTTSCVLVASAFQVDTAKINHMP
jgi:uncharacterized MAPEG superfamily protein